MTTILRRLSRTLAFTLVIILLGAAPVVAEEIADYTSFPPFLPRVVSPNILFMLDYSASMVRPAYGVCSDQTSDCRRVFNNMVDDYNAAIRYSGYFDNDYLYNCTSGNSAVCAKSTTGQFDGNWLNWLTMTQYDILKKVVVGGDITASPEQGNPTKIQSLLNNSIPNASASQITSPLYRNFFKVVKNSKCVANADDALCGEVAPQIIPYKWIDTPASGVDYLWGQTVYVDDQPMNRDLPFSFSYFDTAYSKINISENGYIQFTNSADPVWADYTNDSLPNASSPNNIVAIMWDDLIKAGTANSYVAMFTVGTAPNRICVISYNDIYPWSNVAATTAVSFQILLYETGNQIVFQYKDVDGGLGTYTPSLPDVPNNSDKGRSATIGLENSTGTVAKQYAAYGSTLLSNNLALHMTYGYKVFNVFPDSTKQTVFRVSSFTDYKAYADLSSSAASKPDYGFVPFTDSGGTYYKVYLDLTNTAKVSGACPAGYYINKFRNSCYDHITEGLLQEFRDGELAGLLGFRLGIMQFNSNGDGGAVVKHFNQKDDTGWSSLMTATRGQLPISDAPIAEAMYEAQGYFRQDTAYRFANNDWTNDGTTAACNSTGTQYDPYCFQSAAQKVPCAKSYVLLVTSGNYSHDFGQNVYDDPVLTTDKAKGNTTAGWRTTDDSGAEETRVNGGLLDNVIYKMYMPDATTPDLRSDIEANQVVSTYVVNTFGADSGRGTTILKRAAKYGGFKDSDGDGSYDAGEDDTRIIDGLPDNYFEASGGGDIKAKIVSAVMDILKNSASGTSVSVLSTSAGGEGALYQAYFYPSKVDEAGEGLDTRWPGYLRAFLLDRYQNLRDDYSGSGTSDAKLVLSQDRVARMFLDTTTNEVKIKLFNDSDGDGKIADTANPDATTLMDEAVSLWEGGQKLAIKDKDDRNVYLWVDTDNDGVVDDSSWDSSGESRMLGDWSPSDIKNYLRAAATVVGTETFKSAEREAEDLLDFMQGNHVNGFRNRCIYIPSATANESGCSSAIGGRFKRIWPLGDIIFSTPTLVSVPGEKYDAIYGEVSYKPFTTMYKNRRNVVYVGANDGMLHAFNAGVYQQGDDSATAAVEQGRFIPNPTSDNGWTSPEPTIGDELWSYIPYDNLPHLAWLACNGTSPNPADNTIGFDPNTCFDAEYTHVYYADQRPKVTDLRIFNDAGNATLGYAAVTGKVDGQTDVVHPNGWGTVMLIPLRLGGGAIDVDVDGNGTKERPFRSAIYAFDITNPEKPPKLLWRFTNTNLGFTTTYPVISHVKANTANPLSVDNEKWYLVIGSGPQNLPPGSGNRDYGFTTATTQNGHIFVVDMLNGSLARDIDTGKASSIMGDATAVDPDIDFVTDVIYVGSAVSVTSGRIYRINTAGGLASGWTLTTLFDVDPTTTKTAIDPDSNEEMGPLFVGPSVSKDASGNLWVFFGTGRLKSKDDINNSDKQRFYGIKDGCWQSTATKCTPTTNTISATTYRLADLMNTSAVKIADDTGSATQVSADATICGGTSTSCSYATLLATARTKPGWYIDLDDPTGPSERVLARGSVLGGLVLFTTYQPASDLCSILGNSRLYALYYESGTAFNKKIFKGTDATSTSGDEGRTGSGTTENINRSMSLGQGMPTSVGVAIGETVSGFVQKSTGEIIRIETAPGLSVRSGASSWRETSNPSCGSGIETIYKHIIK